MVASKKFVVLGILLAASTIASESRAGNCRSRSSQRTYCYTTPVTKPAPPVVKAEVTTKVTVTATVAKLVEVPQGSSLRVKVNFLGTEPGFVFLTAGELVLKCEIQEWTTSNVVFRLPELGILAPKAVRLDIARPDGRIARSANVMLVPTNDIQVIASDVVEPRAPRRVSGNPPIANTGGLTVGQ